MAIYNFTTSGSNWSLVVDGSTKGPWPRHANGISSPLYKVDTTGTAIVLSVNAEPYYSTKIRSTDTVQINGVEKTGTLTEKEMAIESEVIAAESTGGGATTVTVYQLKTVLTDAQIKALSTGTPVNLVPAPGVGKLLVYKGAIFSRSAWAAGYGGIESGLELLSVKLQNFYMGVGFTYTEGTTQLLRALLGDLNPGLPYAFFDTPVATEEPIKLIADGNSGANSPLSIMIEGMGSEYTGGNPANTLEVTVFYSIVDL